MPPDAVCSALLIGVVVSGGALYALHRARGGQFRSARVDRAGASVLLGARPMEAAYFLLDPLASVCAAAGISANAITAVSLLLGLASGVALALGHFGAGVLLAGLSALGDALDGQVARRTGSASDAGEVVDAAVDRYVEFFFLGGVAVHYRESIVALVLTLGAVLGSFMVSYSTAKAEALHVEPPRGAMRRAERAVYLVLGAALMPLADVFAQRLSLPRWLGEAPMLAALALVSLVANASALRRLHAIASAVAPQHALAVGSSHAGTPRRPGDRDAPSQPQERGDVAARPRAVTH